MNDYLVYEGGRFRKPGSSYYMRRDLKGNVLRQSVSARSSRRGSRAGSRRGSVRSSQKSVRSGSKRRSRKNSVLKSSSKKNSFVFEKHLVGNRMVSRTSSARSQRKRVLSSSKQKKRLFELKHVDRGHENKFSRTSKGSFMKSGSNFKIGRTRMTATRNGSSHSRVRI